MKGKIQSQDVTIPLLVYFWHLQLDFILCLIMFADKYLENRGVLFTQMLGNMIFQPAQPSDLIFFLTAPFKIVILLAGYLEPVKDVGGFS